jgi:hypothetical protein
MSDTQNSKKTNFWQLQNKKTKFILALVIIILILFGGSFSFFVWASPKSITFPKKDHAHFRLQYVFLGQNENFASSKYQVDYPKNICSGGLTDSPIHLHDNTDQIIHLHWQRVTGGEVLKFYGLNQIGGLDDTLGFKINGLNFPTKIPIHGTVLPKPQPDDKFFVYTGEPNNLQKREFNDFIKLDLETFLGTESILRKDLENAEKTSNSIPSFGIIQAKANTIEGNILVENNQTSNSNLENSSHSQNSSTKTEDELEKINNFLGNVVIFVQANEPTKEGIQAKFNKLTPLHDSVCGG